LALLDRFYIIHILNLPVSGLVKWLTAYRTIFNTAPASGTEIHVDAASTLFDLDLEISGRAFDRFKISIGDQFDI